MKKHLVEDPEPTSFVSKKRLAHVQALESIPLQRSLQGSPRGSPMERKIQITMVERKIQITMVGIMLMGRGIRASMVRKMILTLIRRRRNSWIV
jgi:hypothetical protein